MSMTFDFFLKVNAKKYPDRTALICEERILTYKDIHIRTNRLANALRNLGIRKGDRVSLYLTNCTEYFEAIFAISKIGAVFVPISYRLAPGEMKYVVDDSESIALFFSDSLTDNVLAVHEELAGVPKERLVVIGEATTDAAMRYEELLQSGGPEDPDEEVLENDPHYIGYTSGTTGFPKGAVFTHKARMTTMIQFALDFGFLQGDTTLCAGPMYHGAPCYFSLVHLFLGGQVILMKEFDVRKTLENIQRHKITTAFMVPTMYNMIINSPHQETDTYDLRSIRVLISAAAPLPTKVKEGILKFFPNALFHEFYGFTEVGIATNLQPADHARKTRCVGLPTYFADVKILDDNGDEVPPGEEGIVYVYKGPYCMDAYYKNPEGTQTAFRGNWITAQDIGRLDEEGYLYIVDRKADMVISGGVNIYPTEIEEVLHKHPKVLEATVIGIPDEKWGESLLAFIVPKPEMEVTTEEIVSFLEGKISRYKIPRSVRLLTELPRSPAGKVLKRVLREPFWKDHEARI